jgi:hypothetical protein
MKRIVALLVVLGVSGLIIGCGGKPTPAPTAPKPDMGKPAASSMPPAGKPDAKPADKGDEAMEDDKGPADAAEPKEPSEPASPAEPEKKPETETEEKPE